MSNYECPNCHGLNGLHSGMDVCPPNPIDKMRDWWFDVFWNDGPFIMGDPDRIMPGVVKFDHEKLAALQGKAEIVVQASTIVEAFAEAARVCEEDMNHRVWQISTIS